MAMAINKIGETNMFCSFPHQTWRYETSQATPPSKQDGQLNKSPKAHLVDPPNPPSSPKQHAPPASFSLASLA